MEFSVAEVEAQKPVRGLLSSPSGEMERTDWILDNWGEITATATKLNLKMGKALEQSFLQKRHTNGQQVY